MQHQISTADILHDEIHARLCLETRMQIQQERMSLLVGDQEHPLLRSRALHFIVLDDKLLLEHLDRVQLLRRFRLRQHHLAEVPFAQHR